MFWNKTPSHKLNRKEFLTLTGAGLLSAALPTWVKRAVASMPQGSVDGKQVVVLFQRGAADGLNIIPPYADPLYRRSRPTIGLAEPGQKNGVIDLDGRFGLHPALASLKPMWDQKRFAVVHAAGSPDGTRSHFDAQDNMETGTPGIRSTQDGWLNRALLPFLDKSTSPLTAVSISPRLPRILRGGFPVTSMNNIQSYKFLGGPEAQKSFEEMYQKNVDLVLSSAGKETADAVKMLQDVQMNDRGDKSAGSYQKNKISRDLYEVSRLIRSNVGLRVGFVEMGGWDHHANEGSADGVLNQRLTELGGAIASFYESLGNRADDVLLVTMTEFGRTMEENGNRGTDHGHGSVMMLFGGGIKGGKVYGRWPGLEKENLNEGRDLEVTTDFRQVLSEIVGKQLAVKDLDKVFPRFKPGQSVGFV